MYQALFIAFVLVSMNLVILIMLQQRKNNNLGMSFSPGSVSCTLFGSKGSSIFLSRTIIILAMLFFILCLWLGNLNNNYIQKKNHIYNINEIWQKNNS